VIIPTYNEFENIFQIINNVLLQSRYLHILVVDDNSPDGTSDVVKELALNNNRIYLIQRVGKLGLGSAYVTGFKYAIEKGYEYIIQMDADFSHNPSVIPKFMEEIKEHDCVVGSRYISGINVVNWPLHRLILSYFAAQYVKVITGMPIKDPTGGYKCIKTSVLNSINLDKIMSDGYSFQIEINYRIWLKKYKMKEIPIVFVDRRVGQSKLSKKIVKEAIYMVWKLKWFAMFKRL